VTLSCWTIPQNCNWRKWYCGRCGKEWSGRTARLADRSTCPGSKAAGKSASEPKEPTVRLADLQGIGRGVWSQDGNIDDFIREERESWDAYRYSGQTTLSLPFVEEETRGGKPSIQLRHFVPRVARLPQCVFIGTLLSFYRAMHPYRMRW